MATRCENILQAAIIGNNLRISAIFEMGVDVDTRNEYGQTAVFIAAQHGHYETVVTLVEGCGADLAIPANGGVSAVMAAVANGHHRVVCDDIEISVCVICLIFIYLFVCLFFYYIYLFICLFVYVFSLFVDG